MQSALSSQDRGRNTDIVEPVPVGLEIVFDADVRAWQRDASAEASPTHQVEKAPTDRSVRPEA